MFEYSHEQLQDRLAEVIRQNISSEAWTWLQERTIHQSYIPQAFVAVPRKTGKQIVALSDKQKSGLQSIRKGFSIDGWSVDRLARVWLLLQLDSSDKDQYFQSIEKLFRDAEVNELVALYSSLPLLAYPQLWAARCAEGIRNNIADVLTAIMCNNPYPSEQLNEQAWNQLVLKAFFTEKPIEQIIGIDSRSNIHLAATLSDYAHERWAAHRSVNPQLWRCAGKFIDAGLFRDIQKIASSGDEIEQQAAALACNDSNYPAAKKLLQENKEYYNAIASGLLTWDRLAEKINKHVLQ